VDVSGGTATGTARAQVEGQTRSMSSLPRAVLCLDLRIPRRERDCARLCRCDGNRV